MWGVLQLPDKAGIEVTADRAPIAVTTGYDRTLFLLDVLVSPIHPLLNKNNQNHHSSKGCAEPPLEGGGFVNTCQTPIMFSTMNVKKPSMITKHSMNSGLTFSFFDIISPQTENRVVDKIA